MTGPALETGSGTAELATGITVTYTVDGEGPPVLMLGGPHTSELMRGFLKDIFTGLGWQLITTEYRGVPPSDSPEGDYTVPELAADIAALLESLGVTPCRVFGYSLGSLVVQQLLITRPELVARAVLAGTRLDAGVVYRRMHQEFLDRASAGSDFAPATETMMRSLLMFGPRRLANDAFAGTIAEVLGYSPTEGYNATGLTSASLTYAADPDDLAGIGVPCRVIGLEHDVLTPAGGARLVAAAIPDAEYVELPKTGHGVFLERSQELVKLVTEFLEERP